MQPITYRHLRRKLRQATHLYTATRTEAQQLHKQLAQQQVAAASLSATLLQTVTTAVLAENDQQQITLLNQRFCDLFGLPESPQSYVGQLQTQVYTQAAHALLHSPATQHSTTQAVAQQQPLRDVVIPLSNGLIVKQQYLPVVLEGHTLLHLWSYEDVTAQQCAQRRIEELSRLAEQSPHPIICFNSRGEAQYTNPAGRAVLDVLTDQSDNMAFLQREIARALHEGQACVSEWPLQQQLYLWTVVPLAGENCANVYLTDLTGQRRAERDLLRGQLFTNRINDTVPNLVYLYDLEEGRLLYANQQSLPLLGYTPAELQEMSTNLLSMLMREEDAALVKKQIQATGALADGETLLNEYHIRHRDGSSRWLRTRTVAFTCYPNGQVRQLVGSAEDVTAQRTIAEELRHNRLLLERIINTAPNLIYIFDLEESRSVYCNHHTEIILGYTSEEIVGMGPAMMQRLIPPKQRRLLQQHWNQLVQAADGDVFTLEYHMPHRDGSSRWLRIRSTPFERDATGRVKLVVGSAEDITPWKLAEKQQLAAAQRLEEQNRLFRQVIDSTPHLIYLKDHTGRYVLANEATAQLHSMSLPELLAASPEELHPIPEQRRKYLFQDQQVISTRQELRAEKEFTRPNGQPVWLYTIKRPFVLADGSVQVLGIDSNITNLKQTQLALNEAKENAEKTARAKQDFLANMSHEIRTPMHGILGIAGLLAKTKLTTSQQEYLQHIRESAEHLLVVINDILAITQLGAGKIKVEATSFDVRDVLHRSLESVRFKAQEKKIKLELCPPPTTDTRVVGDPYRLTQILLNLLGNAIKFTEQGQITLRCERLSPLHAPPRFAFTVQDTGIGIPAPQLRHIFEAFTQASASTAREYGGTGLGLSISKGLVELLGGTITVESQVHQGSAFRVELPFRQPDAFSPAAASTPTAAAAHPPLGPYRILLAEDNEVNQFLTQKLLRNWGLEVDTALNGKQAVQLFQQHAYALVLMDIQMPTMDGPTATRLLQRHPDAQRAATPVIALTAHAFSDEEQRYCQAGFVGYLSKPFREEQLYAVLTRFLPAAANLPTEPPLFNLTALQQIAQGDDDFVRNMVQLFNETVPPAIDKMERHAAQQEWQRLSEMAHHLKSTFSSLHITAVQDALRQLELITSSPLEPELVAALVQHIRQVAAAVMKQLKTQL